MAVPRHQIIIILFIHYLQFQTLVWIIFKRTQTEAHTAYHHCCLCLDLNRQGKCADKLSNYLGDIERLRSDSYRYFVRTSASGANIEDTSKLPSHPDDFAYFRDNTFNPRKVFLKIPTHETHLTSVSILHFLSAC